MDAILIGCLATMAIIMGGIFVMGRHRALSVLLGIADVVLVILSAWRFRELLLASGKILTPELFGFGYNKPVLFVYALMALIGLIYVSFGVKGFSKKKE